MYKKAFNIKLLFSIIVLSFVLSPGLLKAQVEEGSDVPEKLIRALAKSLLKFESQKAASDSTLLSSESFLELPPLEDCLDSAVASHPMIKTSDIAIDIRDREITSERKAWLSHFFIESSYRYGNTFNLIQYENNPNNEQMSSQNQVYYYAGGNIRYPLEDIFNRKNKVKIAKDRKEQAIQDKHVAIRSLRNQVISVYNEVLMYQQIVTAANSNQQELAQQVTYASMEFEQNNITVEEYARVKDMFTKAKIEFEQARFNLNRTYMLLQELAGFNF